MVEQNGRIRTNFTRPGRAPGSERPRLSNTMDRPSAPEPSIEDLERDLENRKKALLRKLGAVADTAALPELAEDAEDGVEVMHSLPQEGDTVRRVRQPNRDGSSNDSLYEVRNVGQLDNGETVVRLKNERGVRRTVPLSEFLGGPTESGSSWQLEPKDDLEKYPE